MGVLLFLRPSRLSDRVGIPQSIRIDFAVVKHCPHFVLKVFDGFQLLVHLQTTKKKGSTHASLSSCKQSGAGKLRGDPLNALNRS
jgi:hypothetical protein